MTEHVNVDEALDIIADYATMIATRDGDLDKPTPTVAQTLDELFESKVWVDEYLEVHPQPKRPPNNWTPDSRSRFTQWTRRKAADTGRAALSGAQQYALMDAARISAQLSDVRKQRVPLPERTARAMKWLWKNHYEDRATDVWKRAVALAGSEDAVTSAHTKQALAEWKKEVLGPKGIKSTATVAKAKTLRNKATTLFDQLLELAKSDEKARDELALLMEHVDAALEAGQAA